jgi:signal transduction histidine kinase
MPTSQQASALEPAAAVEPADTPNILRLMAHELRQPLSTIDSIACYLELVLPPGETGARIQASKLQGLVAQVNGILSDALYYLQAAPAQPESTDLTDFVRAAAGELRNTDVLDFRLNVERRPLRVLVDLDQFRHMLRNLLRFCAQAAPAGEMPEVSLHQAGDRVCLRVSVPSPGFWEPDPERMFEPFASHLPAGSGLILASARRVAEAHGGSLEAQATPSGLSLTAVFPEATIERTSRTTGSGAQSGETARMTGLP